MAKWKNIYISKDAIIAENSHSVLIKMPDKSNYKGYNFWHSKKLLRKGKGKSLITFGFTYDFNFILTKYNNESYNQDDISSMKYIDAYTLEKAFQYC